MEFRLPCKWSFWNQYHKQVVEAPDSAARIVANNTEVYPLSFFLFFLFPPVSLHYFEALVPGYFPIIRQSGWPTVNELIEHEASNIVYKQVNGQADTSSQHCLSSYRKRGTENYVTPKQIWPFLYPTRLLDKRASHIKEQSCEMICLLMSNRSKLTRYSKKYKQKWRSIVISSGSVPKRSRYAFSFTLVPLSYRIFRIRVFSSRVNGILIILTLLCYRKFVKKVL